MYMTVVALRMGAVSSRYDRRRLVNLLWERLRRENAMISMAAGQCLAPSNASE